ncbi:hypothetical protein Tco_0840948 [Tanacetum coccineum]|uniref:Uncharacterized protein n=1 Tax=Tanacetum coccineum TaxID=301880 RepID=A0ABQ5AV02_9ASTR
MADKEKKSTMKRFVTNDQTNYYSWITSITVNGKNAYELKGKFLDDFHNSSFSETNREDAVEHIKYFLRIVDPINLPNDVLTKDTEGFKTYEEYKDDWIYKWNKDVLWVHEKPWTENGVWEEPTPVKHLGNTLCYQDLEWYNALKDSKLKEKALRNKAIMEGLINEDVESNNKGWRSWENFKNINSNRYECEYENQHEDDERYELCGNETHDLPIGTVRRFEMIKYSFGQDEEYVAVKEDEYEDLTSTSKDACQAYQEIFRMIDEGWMVTRAELKEMEAGFLMRNNMSNRGGLASKGVYIEQVSVFLLKAVKKQQDAFTHLDWKQIGEVQWLSILNLEVT